MTRTPRSPLHAFSNHLRTRIPAGLTRKTVAYAGAGLALAGVAGGTAAAGFAGSPAPAAAATTNNAMISGASGGTATDTAEHTSGEHSASGQAGTKATQKDPGKTAPAQANAAKTGDAKATPAKQAPAKQAPAKQAPAKHTVSVKPGAKQDAPAKHSSAKPDHAASDHKATKNHERTWSAVTQIVAKKTYPQPGHGALPAQDQLTPVGTSGPQTYMPITHARWDNAKTIVHEAIKKHMGLRAAVIAVATSMQESTLLNLSYGDSDSLGLFQQRPSCGWGSAGQIQHPAYAAGAFLNALHDYQASNPGWAHEPLWQTAQGVQASGYPSAYAKWEAQAAHLVASVTKHLV
jgi:hypothetical protein